MKLGARTLGLFSPPAARFLARLERRRPPSRAAVEERLRRAGRAVFDAVVDFEARFGGLAFGPPGARGDVRLGIDYRPPRQRDDAPDHPDLTMVPIGFAHDEHDELYMNDLGEVVTHVDSVVMKNASIVKYIEQELVWYVPRRPRPVFSADVRPAAGERLAGALGLGRMEAVSDDYEVWWEGEGVRVRQVLFPGSWISGHTTVTAKSLDRLAHAMARAHALDPAARFAVSADPRETIEIPEDRAPKLDALDLPGGAVEYPYGVDEPHIRGKVVVVGGGSEIRQYRVREREGRAPRLLAHDTITSAGERTADIEYDLFD